MRLSIFNVVNQRDEEQILLLLPLFSLALLLFLMLLTHLTFLWLARPTAIIVSLINRSRTFDSLSADIYREESANDDVRLCLV